MGQSDSKQAPLKHFINTQEDITADMVEGCLLTSTVPLAVIDDFPDLKVVIRAEWDKSRVAVISGGGSGHEPYSIEFIGEGLLTAVAIGGTYRTPNTDAIVQAIAAVCGEAGCLIVVMNYLATRLHFEAASHIAESKLGVKVRVLYVADDIVGVKDKEERLKQTSRGMPGTALVLKVAGAAAAAGLDLDHVYEEAQKVAIDVVSLGVAYTRGTLPTRANADLVVPDDSIELGVGMIGEPGWVRAAATATAKDIVDLMIARLEPFIPESGPLCMMLNNLGAVPRLEMAIIAKQAMQSTVADRVELLAGPFRYCTAFATNGFSISLLPIDESIRNRLMAPTEARSWIMPTRPNRTIKRFKSVAIAQANYEPSPSSEHPVVFRLLGKACAALIEAEEEIGTLSLKVATGALGFALSSFARRLQDMLTSLPLAQPSGLFEALSQQCAVDGGLMFALFRIIFGEAAQHLSEGGHQSEWDLVKVVEALRRGVKEAQKTANTLTQMRTFFDALVPAIDVSPHDNTVESWLREAARAARRGARATADMTHCAQLNVPLERRAGVFDGGAVAVATVFSALDGPLEGIFRRLPEERTSISMDPGDDNERERLREEAAKAEIAKLYQMQDHAQDEPAHYDGRFRKFHIGIAQTGKSKGKEFCVRVLRSTEIKRLGVPTLREKLVMERLRMLNWLFTPKPHIAKVFEIFQTPTSYYYVLENLHGPSLREFLERESSLTQQRIASIFKQVLMAVRELHSSRLIHRDIKAENFIFDGESDQLKLVEVCGCLCHLSESREIEYDQTVVFGTAAYMSPEAISGHGRQGADMWACGVLLHLMLAGDLPFQVSSLDEAQQLFNQEDWHVNFSGKVWQNISPAARNMVERLLERNVRYRMTVFEALSHAWVAGESDTHESLVREGPAQITPNCAFLVHGLSRQDSPGKEDIGGYPTSPGSAARISTTIFLFRHGEAVHNIEEKSAKNIARDEALAKGLEPGSEDYKEFLEEARRAVLHNADFYDAALSDKGRLDALTAKKELSDLYNRGLPKPTAVLVSPLQRTLQTSSLIFPYHASVTVCEELRERMTGLPCDSRSQASQLDRRPSFQHMDFRAVKTLDMRVEQNGDTAPRVEGKAELRERAAQFLRNLPYQNLEDQSSRARQHQAVAIVTHKGFLRELERGILGHPDAAEFNTCELRVYDVTWTLDGQVESPALCLYSNASLCTLRMQNFPPEFVTPEALPSLARRVDEKIRKFGRLRDCPTVEKTPSGPVVHAVFEEQKDAKRASQALHGLDIRSEAEKRERQNPLGDEKFWARLVWDVESEEWHGGGNAPVFKGIAELGR